MLQGVGLQKLFFFKKEYIYIYLYHHKDFFIYYF